VIRRLPFHPPLWASWPVLVLWGANWRLVSSDEVLPTLLAVVLFSLIAWALFALVGVGMRGSAIASTILAVAAQFAGLLPGPSLTPATALLVLAALLAWWPRRLESESLGVLTWILNLSGIAVVAVALAPILLGWLRAPDTLTLDAPLLPATAREAQRDVLYVIPDRLGRPDVLHDDYGWDATPFVQALEERGFAIASESAANYPKTAHSLAAAWNLQYLDDLVDVVPADAASDLRLLNPLLDEHHLGTIAQELGYEYIHLGSWWAPTARASIAAVNLMRPGLSQFGKVHLDRTVLPSLANLVPFYDYEDYRRYARGHVEYGLRQLADLAEPSTDRPRFVVAHLTIPHDPYVFDLDGSWVPEALERSRSEADAYRRHVAFTERALLEVFDLWLDRPPSEQPIIVLQPDEGPHPARLLADPNTFRWVDATSEEQRQKLAILTAIHAPGTALRLSPSLTPVNTWRLLFDEYHGTEFGLLADRSFVYTSEVDLYEFTEVTPNVR
jgi:hypothetical protein